MKTFRWRIYYDDGSVFSDTDGEPWESPPWGAVAVSQGSLLLVGNGDYYIYRTDLELWHEVGDSGLMDNLVHFGHLISCVRPGRWMPRHTEFKALVARIRAEMAV